MKNDELWLKKYKEYTEFIHTNKRCPSKYKPEERPLVNWMKYNRKVRNKGHFPASRESLFAELSALASRYHHVNQYDKRAE